MCIGNCASNLCHNWSWILIFCALTCSLISLVMGTWFVYGSTHPTVLSTKFYYDQKVGVQSHTFGPRNLIVGVQLLRLLQWYGAYVQQPIMMWFLPAIWMSLIPYSMVSEAQYIQSKWLQAKYLSLSLNNIKVHISMLTSITVCKQYESLVNAHSIYFPMQRSSLHQRSVALSYNLQMLDSRFLVAVHMAQHVGKSVENWRKAIRK